MNNPRCNRGKDDDTIYSSEGAEHIKPTSGLENIGVSLHPRFCTGGYLYLATFVAKMSI